MTIFNSYFSLPEGSYWNQQNSDESLTEKHHFAADTCGSPGYINVCSLDSLVYILKNQTLYCNNDSNQRLPTNNNFGAGFTIAKDPQ